MASLRLINNNDLEDKPLTMEDLEKEYDNKLTKGVGLYRKLTHSLDGSPITEINEAVLNTAGSALGFISKPQYDKLRERILESNQPLNEEDVNDPNIVDKIADAEDISKEAAEEVVDSAEEIENKTDQDIELVCAEGMIEKILNRALTAGLRSHRIGGDDKSNFNVMFEGAPGCGKTERVKAWVRRHKNLPDGYTLRLVQYKPNELTPDDIKNVPTGQEDPDRPGKSKMLSLGTFEPLEAKNDKDLVILFLDEYNRAPATKRQEWLKIIDEKTITDPSNKETRTKKLNNLLFTVAAINPTVDEDGEEVDDEGLFRLGGAERARFAKQNIDDEDLSYITSYYRNHFKELIRKDPKEAREYAGRLNILETLFGSEFFQLPTIKQRREDDYNQVPTLNFRSLDKAIMGCDGTKKDFLDFCPLIVGDRATKQFATILAKYEDIPNEANAVWDFWKEYGVQKPKGIDDEETSKEEAGKSILSDKENGIQKLQKRFG